MEVSSSTVYLNMVTPFLVVSWIVLIALTLWKPQRFKNAFALMAALGFTLLTAAAATGDDMPQVMLAFGLIICAALLFVPFMLIKNGIEMLRLEGRSTANLLSLFLGIFVGLGELAWFGFLFNTSIYNLGETARSVVIFIALSVFYFSSLILMFVLYNIYIQYIPKSLLFDYVIIHGCGLLDGHVVSPLLAARVDKAIQVYTRAKTKPILIPSGGRGSDESISEAQAMHDYLIEHGIPESDIYMEDESTTTMENLANCKKYIDARAAENNHDGVAAKHKRPQIALVSSNYHVYRCLLYAETLKMKCIGIGAPVAWYYWPSALIREFVAIFTRPKYIIWTVIGYLILVVLPSFGF